MTINVGDVVYIKEHMSSKGDKSIFSDNLARVTEVSKLKHLDVTWYSLICGPELYNSEYWAYSTDIRLATEEEAEAWHSTVS